MVRSGPSNECIACEHFVEEWCILKGNDDAACPISKELRLWGFRAEDERYTDGVWRFFKDKFMAQTFAKGKRVVEKDPLTALAMYNKSRFKHYDLSRFLDEFVEKIPRPIKDPSMLNQKRICQQSNYRLKINWEPRIITIQGF